MKRFLLFLVVASLAAPASAQLFNAPMTPTTPGASMTLGAGLPAALANPANSNGGVSLLGGSVTSGDCLIWGTNGIQDAGSACATSNVTGTGAPVATSLSDRATDFGVTFNLKNDFGAKCDGLHDDTTAIQNWLNKAAANVNLVAPGGTCLFSTPLTAPTASNYVIGGAGASATALLYTGATTASPLINLGSATETGVLPHDFSVTTVNPTTGPMLAINGIAYTPPSVANRRIVNILDFGADPTGATDSTAAINLAYTVGTNANQSLSGYNPLPCVYVPAGNYTISNAIKLPSENGCLFGDGRTVSILNVSSATFNLSAQGVVVVPTNGGATGPIIRDIGIQFTQPDVSSRASIVAFPPGIYMQNGGRPVIERVRIGGGSYCIDARGNTGGAFYNDVECGALVSGMLLGGPPTYSGATGLQVVTGGSYVSSTATLTGTWAAISGKVAVVQGASPSCLNGSWPITTSITNSISFTDAGCSAWTAGGTVSTIGALDGVHIYGWHEWDFGLKTPGLQNIYSDGTNQCFSIGRVDWIGVDGIQCFLANIVFNYDANNAVDESTWGNVGLDSSLWTQAGGYNLVTNLHMTDGGLTPPGSVTDWPAALSVSSGTLNVTGFNFTRHNPTSAGAINVSGGSLIMSGGNQLQCFLGNEPCVVETGGTLAINGSHIAPTNGGAWTEPYIYQTGGVIQLGSNWLDAGYAGGYTFADVTDDTAGSFVLNNNLNGWILSVPSSATETQYGYNYYSQNNIVAGNTITANGGNISVISTSGAADFYAYGNSGGGTGIALGLYPSTIKWIIRNTATNNYYTIFDQAANLNWLQIVTGGNATLGEQASNVTTLHGTLSADSADSAPTITGTCAVVSPLGGQMAGSFKAPSGGCSSETVILTFAATLAHGYACDAHDTTTPADVLNETAFSTTSVTFTASALAANDVVVWKCMGF